MGPRLETERLLLRPPLAEDFDAWANFMADPIAMETLGGVVPRSTAWRIMATMVGAWQLRGFAMFSVIEKGRGEWIGRVGPWEPEGWPGREVGWGLASFAWGKGYAVEAASASIDWAFDVLGWHEVIHCIESSNERSRAVARRLGSKYLRQGVMPPPIDLECEIWGQSRDEWRKRSYSNAR